jgi:hypothetical protein
MISKIYAVVALMLLALFYYSWAEAKPIFDFSSSTHSHPQGPGQHFHK